jgi:PucR C-terminal helix-turn-helix domain/GGDEF-like domain
MTARTRGRLVGELRSKRPALARRVLGEIEQITPSFSDGGDDYAEGVRSAVETALTYAIEGLSSGPEWEEPVPPGLLNQARRAAHHGVELDSVLRRYTVGERTLSSFIVSAAEPEASDEVVDLLQVQSFHLDRVLSAVAAEYRQEEQRRGIDPAERLKRRVIKLLEGKPTDVKAIDYSFDRWHIGLITSGPRRGRTAEQLAERLGAQALVLRRDDCFYWAWLGADRQLSREKIARAVAALGEIDGLIAVGESRLGLGGWRQTHGEARLAMRVLRRSRVPALHSSDSLLLAAAIGDPEVEAALKETFLDPLGSGTEGEALRATLRAYFRAGRNASAAGAELQVDRQTVQRRLRKIEQLLGRRLESCPEIEVALHLANLTNPGEL